MHFKPHYLFKHSRVDLTDLGVDFLLQLQYLGFYFNGVEMQILILFSFIQTQKTGLY